MRPAIPRLKGSQQSLDSLDKICFFGITGFPVSCLNCRPGLIKRHAVNSSVFFLILKMGDVCNYGFLGRRENFSIAWKDCMLIFGGWTEKESPCLPSHIQVLCDGRWRCVQTRGLIFAAKNAENAENVEGVKERILLNTRTAQLIGDKVYLMATTVTRDDVGPSWIGGLIDKIFVLDLATWTWTDLDPKGNAPIMVKGNVTWVHQEKMYVFGGLWRGDVSIAYSLDYPTGRHEVTFDTNTTNQGHDFNAVFWSIYRPRLKGFSQDW